MEELFLGINAKRHDDGVGDRSPVPLLRRRRLLFLFLNLIETRLVEEERCIGRRRQGGPITREDWFRFRLYVSEGIVCLKL